MKLGADGFLNIKKDTVWVEMEDESVFKGKITDYMGNNIPKWMQPNEARLTPGFWYFIRTEQGTHYHSALLPFSHTHNHNPFPHGPKRAEIRIGNIANFTAQFFTIYEPPRRPHFMNAPNFPCHNRIYVLMTTGPIYSAILDNRNPGTHYTLIPKIEYRMIRRLFSGN